ncbi:MAG: type I methionyl aminopeptidase, partial [Patescibacteria group bacterium]
EPEVPNYGGENEGPIMRSGLVIAIEPMVNEGGRDEVIFLPDGFTVKTRDGSRSAHFEHTVAITETGAEILTSLN